jgi:hypothetical protein
MRSPLIHFALLFTCAAGACAQGIITTVAGTDLTYPSGSFPANNASFGQLSGVAVNPVTGEVYFASGSGRSGSGQQRAGDPQHRGPEQPAGDHGGTVKQWARR